MRLRLAWCIVLAAGSWACGPLDETPPLSADPERGSMESSLVSAQVRRQRAEAIRDVGFQVGITSGVLFAGIGQAETGLAHCDAEVGYGCPGPASASCGGGPVLAGGADGPCGAQRGGLGMFQFDSGTYQDTLNAYGPDIVTFEGNVKAAFEFMIVRLMRSAYVNVNTREEAIAWINSVAVGNANYAVWLKNVTHYYNGCSPGGCSLYGSRYAKYDNATQQMLLEFGDDFWGTPGTPQPLPQSPPTSSSDDAPVDPTDSNAESELAIALPQYRVLPDKTYGGIGCSAGGGSFSLAAGLWSVARLLRRRRR